MAVSHETSQKSATPLASDSTIFLTCLYLIGLLLNNFPPLVVTLGGSTVLRPDWILSIPLLGYTVYSTDIRVDLTVCAACAFAFVAIVSIVVNPIVAPLSFLTLFIQLLYAIGLFIAFISLTFSRTEMRQIFRFWLLLLAAVCVFALLQAAIINIFQIETEAFPLRGFPAGLGYIRPSSVFKEPAFFADTLMTGIAILVPAVVLRERFFFSERLQTALFALLLGTLVISGSIGGLITLVGGFVCIWLLVAPLRGSLSRAVTSAAPTVGSVVVAAQIIGSNIVGTILVRLHHFVDLASGTPRGGSIAVRGSIYLANLKIWSKYPLFGVGFGQHQSKTVTYLSKLESVPNVTLYEPSRIVTGQNGAWFGTLVHTGIIGFLIFSAIWVVAFRRQIGAVYAETGPEQVILLSCTCLTIVLLVGWLYDFSFIHPSRWALVGLAYGYTRSKYG